MDAHERPSATVLVVDDDEGVRDVLHQTLAEAGFEVLEAATGHEALALAERQPDAIVLDVRLPDLGGLEVCRRLRGSPLTAFIPVLMLSGVAISESDRASGLDSGADLYLRKPFQMHEVCRAVDTLVRLRRATDEAHHGLARSRLLVDQLSGVLDLPTVLARTMEIARSLLGADVARVRLREPGSRELRIASSSGRIGPKSNRPIPVETTFSGIVLEERRVIAVEDAQADPRVGSKAWARAEGFVSVLGAPLLIADEAVGVLVCWSRARRAWAPEDVARAETIAVFAAAAIRNARLFEESERRRRIAESLVDIARSLSQSLDPGEVAERVVDRLPRLLEAEAVGLYRHEPVTGELILTAQSHADDWEPVLAPGEGATGLAVRERRPVASLDTHADPRIRLRPDLRARMESSPNRSVLAVPLVIGDRVIGALTIRATAGREFLADEVDLAAAFATHAGMAIENSRLFAAVQHHAQRLRIMREIDQAILAARSSSEIVDVVVRHLMKLFGGWRVSVFVVDVETASWVVLAAAGARDVLPPATRVPLSTAEEAELAQLRRGAIIRVDDLRVGDETPAALHVLAARGLRSYVRVPLVARGELIGSLNIGFDRPQSLTPDDVDIAREVAESLAVAIEQARLNEHLVSSRAQLQALSRRIVETEEAHRADLARELHDEIGQWLTALTLSLEGLARAGARDEIAAARRQVAELTTRVRALSLDLRPAGLDDLGLAEALAGFFDRYTAQTGIRVRFEESGAQARRFRREIETAAYRIVQEALTNVARHAGAGAATVRVWADDHVLGVQVEDAGRGFQPGLASRSGHAGLTGMRERTTVLGGNLEVDSAPGAGTRVTAELPLDP